MFQWEQRVVVVVVVVVVVQAQWYNSWSDTPALNDTNKLVNCHDGADNLQIPKDEHIYEFLTGGRAHLSTWHC